MVKLSCLSLFKSSLAFTGLHFGSFCRWLIPPMLLSAAALLAAFALHSWKGVWALYIPAGIFAVFCWMPYCLRVNQMAILGGVEPGGYAEKIFSRRSLRYVLYAVLLTFIIAVGMGLSLAPVMIAAKDGLDSLDGRIGLILAAVLATLVLVTALLVLTAPLHLIYPAVAVEEEPSLSQAYHLGSGHKFSLVMAMGIPPLVFGLLSALVEGLAWLFLPESSDAAKLITMPVTLTISWLNSITSMAVMAIAYRTLRGLPDPDAPARSAEPQGART
ncbi:hypothetical protein [Fundidesulfovibrio agrisoli]|uniref:hypothetical protein n=1 Tax=Fundidesulfovibrio agrisoli TaxID=2922717 RepID=UPI001FACD90F|nr:hypothetical protein [Fundidesulfovibrio agrisoli]